VKSDMQQLSNSDAKSWVSCVGLARCRGWTRSLWGKGGGIRCWGVPCIMIGGVAELTLEAW